MSKKSKKRGISNKGASLVKDKSKSTDIIPKSNHRIDDITREVENMAPEQQSQKISSQVEAISDPATSRKNKEDSSKVIENDGVLLKRIRSPNLASRTSSLMPPSSTAAISPPRKTVSMNPQNERRRKNHNRSTSTNKPSKEQIKRKGSARSIPTKKRSIATSGRASNPEPADKPTRKNSQKEHIKLAHHEQVKEKSSKQDYGGTGAQCTLKRPTRSMSAPTPRANADLNNASRYQSASSRQQVSRTMSRGGKSIPSRSKFNSKPISSRSASYRETGGVLEKVAATVDRALEKIISVPESLYSSSRHDEKEQLECTSVIESDSIDSLRGGFEEVTPKIAQESTVPQFDDQNDEEKAEETITQQESRSAETASIEMGEEESSFCAQCLVGIALLFDFATTVISWQAHEERSCCGTELVRETISTVITVALLSLIIIEGFALLLQLVFKNARRGLRAHEEKRRQPNKHSFLHSFSSVHRLIIMTMLNPFFGFTISWILLSHAYRLQSLLVFSLQSCGLLLHLASSRLLGSFKTMKTGCFHLLPVIPFLVYGVLLLVFAGSGGICFLSDSKDYFFSGCEICPDGKPTINGVCGLEDGIVVTVTDPKPWEVKGGLFDTARAHPSPMGQGTYCASETQSGPAVSFCFFEYK